MCFEDSGSKIRLLEPSPQIHSIWSLYIEICCMVNACCNFYVVEQVTWHAQFGSAVSGLSSTQSFEQRSITEFTPLV